jgi:response regulator NasT
MRVLIAEDEALIRMDMREMLVEEGHEVVGEARDGAEAIELARAVRPEVIFMDVKMPGMDGIAAAAVIGAERIAPVVMVTAFSQSRYVEEASAAGAMGYLVKPFSKKDILPAMAVAVARFAEARALEDEVADLGERLETRKAVDRAKGLLMAQGMSEPEAFRRLQKLAMDRRKTLREVAEAVLLAAEAQGGGTQAGGTPSAGGER